MTSVLDGSSINMLVMSLSTLSPQVRFAMKKYYDFASVFSAFLKNTSKLLTDGNTQDINAKQLLKQTAGPA
jgi:hypothetical protein